MTINDPAAYVAGIWDWEILNGCFGNTKIAPTDIDGFVERKGHFLILEAKATTATLTKGQLLTFEQLVNDARFTVMIIYGETNSPRRLTIMRKNTLKKYRSVDLDFLRERVAAWFNWADSEPNFS